MPVAQRVASYAPYRMCRWASHRQGEREKRRRLEDNTSDRSKEREFIKIGAYNINRIKGDNMKVELLAEYGKSEGYNIIGIVETNIGEQEGK